MAGTNFYQGSRENHAGTPSMQTAFDAGTGTDRREAVR